LWGCLKRNCKPASAAAGQDAMVASERQGENKTTISSRGRKGEVKEGLVVGVTVMVVCRLHFFFFVGCLVAEPPRVIPSRGKLVPLSRLPSRWKMLHLACSYATA
jgi:hypothetical protein